MWSSDLVAPGAGFTADTAAAEAGRCLDCQCLTCVKHCVFLEHYKSYPKAYARQIYNNSSNVVGIRQANTMPQSCRIRELSTQLPTWSTGGMPRALHTEDSPGRPARRPRAPATPACRRTPSHSP